MHDPLQASSTGAAPPGSDEALDGGCVCSVLLNRLSGGAEHGFVNPLCPLHAPTSDPPERSSPPSPQDEPSGGPDP